jgi:hypothetical protein
MIRTTIKKRGTKITTWAMTKMIELADWEHLSNAELRARLCQRGVDEHEAIYLVDGRNFEALQDRINWYLDGKGIQ